MGGMLTEEESRPSEHYHDLLYISEDLSLSLLVPSFIIYCLLLPYGNVPLGVEMLAQNSLAWFGRLPFRPFPHTWTFCLRYNNMSIYL